MLKTRFCILVWLLVALNATVYAQDEPPVVSSIIPNTGPELRATLVRINGSNFQGGVTVTFGDMQATELRQHRSSIVDVKTPAHPAGTVDVTVTNPDGQADTTENGFTFVPALFGIKTDYHVDGSVNSVFGADLDGDGDNDLAVANLDRFNVGTTVSVLLNNGNGTFAPGVDYAVGDGPSSVFISDLDRDGDNDLAVANQNSGTVSVLLNNGDGTFVSGGDYGVGSGPESVFSADLDGDGDNDLAVANLSSGTVSVLLNNGNGIFAPKMDYDPGNSPNSVFIADLDGDGDNDIVTSATPNVSVLMNNGDGTFAPRVDHRTGGRLLSVFSADLDGDGDNDLAVGGGSGGVYVLLNLSPLRDGDSAVIEYEERSSEIPETYALSQNYPNPFNPQTVIHYNLPVGGHVELSVFNLLGQKVATLVDGHRTAGSYSVVWDGKDDNQKSLASGVYLYRMETDGFVQTRKLLLLR